MSLDRITFSTLLWRHATSLPHLQIATNDEEGEGSGNSRTCVFPIKWHMFFGLMLARLNRSGLCLLGVKAISGISQVEWQSDRCRPVLGEY